jgi:predicted permease
MVLLVGAGLFLRSLANAGSMKPGFDPQNVLVATIDLEPSGYKRADGLALLARLLDRVKATPGAEAVTLSSRVPLSTFNRSSTTIAVDGYSPREGERMDVSLDAVGPDYFRTLRIPILSGRDLSIDDLDGRPLVAIVNDAMARRFWPGGDALGRTFVRGRRRYTVVGVASNVKSYSVNEPARPGIYVPALQEYWSKLYLMARTKGDPGAMSSALRSAVRSVDRGLPVVGLQPMTEHVRFAFFVQRVGGTVLGAVGAVALLLAALGLYAVVSYSAWRRVREFGVRMALGATPGEVVRLVVGQGVRLFAIGAPLGLAGAVGLGAAARSQLYGVSATDPLTFVAATTVLAAVLLAGAGLPAWRASRLDVVRALRNE